MSIRPDLSVAQAQEIRAWLLRPGTPSSLQFFARTLTDMLLLQGVADHEVNRGFREATIGPATVRQVIESEALRQLGVVEDIIKRALIAGKHDAEVPTENGGSVVYHLTYVHPGGAPLVGRR